MLVVQDNKVAEQELDLAPLDAMLDEYVNEHGALIPIMQRTQGIYGYLPEAALRRIAERTGTPLSQLYGVATFYAQFSLTPKGRHTVDLCDGTACHVRGMPQIVTALENDLKVKAGDTTENGRVTLHVVFCLGSCALAPVAVIDGQIVGRLSPQKAVQLVRKLD